MRPEHFIKRPNAYPHLGSASILDVTLRDGGFAVNFEWNVDTVNLVVESCAKAGIPYVELGYVGGLPDQHGVRRAGLTADFPLSLCVDLARRHPNVQLALMVHPGGGGANLDVKELAISAVRLVRFVYHASWHDKLIRLLRDCQAAGLRTSVNIALASRYDRVELMDLVESIGVLRPTVLYLADTCSALYPDQVAKIVDDARRRLSGVALGFHSHDFLTLAFANTIAAIRAGATFVDTSLRGLGRGAGNLRTELWCAAGISQGMTCFQMTHLLPALEAVRRVEGASHRADLASVVAGCFNFTPPEEDCLRKVSRENGVSPDQVAAALADSYRTMVAVNEENITALVNGARG